jgi:hypothetical protein
MPHIKRRANLFLILIGMGLFADRRPDPPDDASAASTTPDTGLPAGITCEMVREKVTEHGKAVALAWALRQGYSFAQIRAARRCVK